MYEEEVERSEYCDRKRQYTSRRAAEKHGRSAGELFERSFFAVRCRRHSCFHLVISRKGRRGHGEAGEANERGQPTAEREELIRESTREVVRRLDERRTRMSITMVPLSSSNVRAAGYDPGVRSVRLPRILVQFDNGVYECVRVDGSETAAVAVFDRFLAASSKGGFYSEQIRRRPDVWQVRKLDEAAASGVVVGSDAKKAAENIVFAPTPEENRALYRDGVSGEWEKALSGDMSSMQEQLESAQQRGKDFQFVSEYIHAPSAVYEGELIGRKRTLILTVGLPKSGKSSWARTTGFCIVSPDAIRLALHGRAFEQLAEPFVWAHARLMVRALFVAGHETVILDACSVTRARRDEWRGSEWETVCQFIKTPYEECMRRAEPEEWQMVDGVRRRFPKVTPVIRAMAAKFEPLGEDETRYEGGSLLFNVSEPRGEMVVDKESV